MSGGASSRLAEGLRRVSAPQPELVGRRVLLVDDDRANLARVREALGPMGYRFSEAHDGTEALGAIQRERPDLVLMDVEMPGLTGVDVCRIVKANAGFGFIPIILMTADKASGKVEGLELGADDYLVKPLDALELAARVKSMLRLKALQDALVEKNRELAEANRELARRREELLALSRTDALTGLFNRRYLEERLREEFARSARYRSPLSLLMLDVDHFKAVNDRHGHPVGDRVLRAVADTARASLRDVDLLARYGGEELVALLPECGPEEAWAVCERVREAVAALALEAATGEVRCTASLGVASVPAEGLDSAEALLGAADACLYEAKAHGRNRTRQRPGE